MMNNQLISRLNALKNVPFEKWALHGIRLKAVSAGSDGEVRSGITSSGIHFFRKYTNNFQDSEFVTE